MPGENLPQWLTDFSRSLGATGRVMGVAIGGSYARGNADALSDYDIFILVEAEELSELYSSPPMYAINLIPGDTVTSYPSIVPEFGIRYCVVSDQVGLCDLFFDAENGFPSPMRTNPLVLWEKDNYFTSVNQRLSLATKEIETQAIHFLRLAAQLATEYDEAVKCIVRNRPIQAWYRVTKVLNLALGTGGLAGPGGWWRSTCSADDMLRAYHLEVAHALFTVSDLSALGAICHDLGGECLKLIDHGEHVDEVHRRTISRMICQSMQVLESPTATA